MNDNWTSKNPPPELSDSDAELLSAYLDNMLDASERSALEARLSTDAFLRSELAALRQMLGWLNTMPQLKAPRNFMISEADVKPAAPKVIPMPRRNNWQLASAAAAVLVVLFGFAALLSQNLAPKAEAEQVALMSSQSQDEQAASPIVVSTSLPMPTAGIPPMASGNSGGAGSNDDNFSGGSAPQEEQEAAITGETRIIESAGDTDFGADLEMNPSDAAERDQTVETQLIEATSVALVPSSVAADGQVVDIARTMPTGTPEIVASYALATATPQPSAVAEESMALSVEQAAPESTMDAALAGTTILEAPVSDDLANATGTLGMTGVNVSVRLNEILYGILQRILEASQR